MHELYHHTDSARPPWILRDQALKPDRIQAGRFPYPDFLWATTDAADRGAGSETERLALDDQPFISA